MGIIRRLARLTLPALVLAAAVSLAQLAICSKCGYENEAALARCSHCQAPLPVRQPEAATNAPAGARTPAQGAFIDEAIVEAELTEAGQALAGGDAELARLFTRNAAALALLTAPELQAKRAKQIAGLLERCELASRTVQRVCTDCNGSGRVQLKAVTLAGGPPELSLPGRVCAACRGTGRVQGYPTITEQIYALGRALKKFGVQQQIRRYVAVGGAWAPADLAETLTARQAARLKTAMAGPCETCAGIGRVACTACNGAGTAKCTNRGCVAGVVEVDEGGQLGGRKIRRNEKCPVCGGASTVACKRCAGKGSTVCTDCNGSGERPLCRPCAGQGSTNCKRCSGTGAYKGAPCVTCHAAGVVLCTGCGGDGRER